jgi:ABC-type nitrate/sulfonate/bicarbonate transport system substrate-binding protein
MRSTLMHEAAQSMIALVLGAAITTLPATAATKLTVGKSITTSDPEMAVDVGEAVGIFKKHDLDLKILNFQGGSKMTQALVAGSIDIADGAGTEMAHVAKGAPMMAVCESSSTFPFVAIGVAWDSPIQSLKQLKNKKIGITSADSLTDWLAHDLARKEGWGDDGVTSVAIGGAASSIIAGLTRHLVDASIANTSLFLKLQEEKRGRLIAPITDFEGPAASGMIFATDSLVAKEPDAVRAFLAGWIESVDYIITHKAETVKIESAVTGFPESVMAQAYDIDTKGHLFVKDCRFDEESLATLKRSLVDLKSLPASTDMSKLYTEAYLPKQ